MYSADNGATWGQTGLTNMGVTSLITMGSNIYAGSVVIRLEFISLLIMERHGQNVIMNPGGASYLCRKTQPPYLP